MLFGCCCVRKRKSSGLDSLPLWARSFVFGQGADLDSSRRASTSKSAGSVKAAEAKSAQAHAAAQQAVMAQQQHQQQQAAVANMQAAAMLPAFAALSAQSYAQPSYADAYASYAAGSYAAQSAPPSYFPAPISNQSGGSGGGIARAQPPQSLDPTQCALLDHCAR